jgi:hypothetical protein
LLNWTIPRLGAVGRMVRTVVRLELRTGSCRPSYCAVYMQTMTNGVEQVGRSRICGQRCCEVKGVVKCSRKSRRDEVGGRQTRLGEDDNDAGK